MGDLGYQRLDDMEGKRPTLVSSTECIMEVRSAGQADLKFVYNSIIKLDFVLSKTRDQDQTTTLTLVVHNQGCR